MSDIELNWASDRSDRDYIDTEHGQFHWKNGTIGFGEFGPRFPCENKDHAVRWVRWYLTIHEDKDNPAYMLYRMLHDTNNEVARLNGLQYGQTYASEQEMMKVRLDIQTLRGQLQDLEVAALRGKDFLDPTSLLHPNAMYKAFK